MTETTLNSEGRRPFTPTWLTIPAIFALTALAAVLTTELVLDWRFGRRTDGGAVVVFACAFVAAGAAFAVGLIVSTAVLMPIKRLAGAVDARPEKVRSFGDALEVVSRSVDAHNLESCTLDSLEGGVVTLDLKGIITSFNAVAERLAGCDGPSVIGGHYSRAFMHGPDDRRFHDLIEAALTRGRTCSSEEAAICTPHAGEAPIGVTISLLRDRCGLDIGIVVIFKNLAEIKQMRRQMRRSEELASLGAMASGMAHEIRNPLGSLRGLTELLQSDYQPGSRQMRYTQTILRSIDHLNVLVEDMLSFGQPSISELTTIEPMAFAGELADFVRYDAQREIRLELPEDPPPVVSIDADRIRQALLNIIRNAFDAAGDDGTVTLSVSGLCWSGGEFALFNIHNTGSFIPPDKIEEMFKPFVTQKHNGTGLGLSISHQIVASHGGRITVSSDRAAGTTFSVLLPAAANEHNTSRRPENALQHSDCR